MGFNVEAALKDGYSVDEIADFLGNEKGIDVSAARKDGWTSSEIVDQLNYSNKAFAKDLGAAVGRGVVGIAETAQGVNAVLEKTSPLSIAGNAMLPEFAKEKRAAGEEYVREKLGEAKDWLTSKIHPQTKGELDKPFLQEGVTWDNLSQDGITSVPGKLADLAKEGKLFGEGATSLDKIVFSGVESMPVSIASMAPAGLAARGAYGRTLSGALASGMEQKAAEKVATSAAERTAMIVGGLSEGATGAGMQFESTRQEVMDMKPEVLAESKAFQAIFDSLPSTMSEQDRFQKAKTEVADRAALQASGIAFLADAGLGALGDRYLGSAAAGKGNILKSAGRGFLQETPTEFGQSGLEQFGTNLGIKLNADKNRSLTQDVGEQAIGGALSGGLIGAGMGAGFHQASRQRAESDLDNAKSVDQVMDAANRLAGNLNELDAANAELGAAATAYNNLNANLSAPSSLTPDQSIELAAAKGAIERTGSLDLSQPSPVIAPAAERQAAADTAMRTIEANNGVATPAQAAIVDSAFPGRQNYDQVVGTSEQVPTVSSGQVILDTSSTPRETVRFDNPLQAENAAAWERFNAQRASRNAEQSLPQQAPALANETPQVNVPAVIEALQVPAFQRTAEQNVTLQKAAQSLPQADMQLLEAATQGRFNLSAEQKIRLNTLEKQGVFPQNTETAPAQENIAKFSTERDVTEDLPAAEQIMTFNPMGEGYTLLNQQQMPDGRTLYTYRSDSAPANLNPQVTFAQNNPQVVNAQNNPQVVNAQNNPQVVNAQNNPQVVSQTGTAVPKVGTTMPNAGATVAQVSTSQIPAIVTVDATSQGNDAVGSTGTVSDGSKSFAYTVVPFGRENGLATLISRLGSLFGKKVVFFQSDIKADGFVLPNRSDRLYINANSKMNPLAVFGHELMHLLKRDNPIAYRAIATVIARRFDTETRAQFRRDYGKNANLEELSADLLGNAFTDQTFLSDVFNEIAQIAPAGEARSIIVRLAAAINKAIKSALEVVKAMGVQPNFKADQIVKNLEDIRSAMREALKTYAVAQKQSVMKLAAEQTQAETKIQLSPSRVPLSTRQIMDQEPGKARLGLGLVENPGRSDNKVREVAQKLNERTVKNFGVISDTDISEEAKMKLAKAMADEVAYQLGTTSETGTGLGWYSTNYPNAVKKLARVFPELGTNKSARDLFTAIVAVTSNGEKVSINISNAIKFYKQYRDTGRLVGSGVGARRAGALESNIDVLESLIEDFGLEGMSSFLMKEMTVGEMNAELRKLGKKTDSSYTADTVIPRAALYFGPKLGAFYANLMGAEGYLTMDLWWSRTFNRMRGVLIPSATENSIKTFGELIGRPEASREEIVQATIEPRNAYESRNYKTELELITGEKEPNTNAGKELWLMKAKKAAGARFDELMQQQRIEKTANTIYKNEYEGLAEAPFRASDRKFMYETTLVVQKLLKRKFGNLSIADIQAALWYYEKRLYATLSGGQANDIGYEEAILEHAQSDRPERPTTRFDSGVDAGNDRTGESVVSEQVLRSGGQAGTRAAKLSRSRVNFEVAPDPNEAPLYNAWNSIPVEKRYDISKSIAEKLIPRALKALGVSGRLTTQVGSYLDDTNVSFALQLDNSDKADQVQKFLGFMLSQDSMVTISEQEFPGAERVGAVTVTIGNDDPAKIYGQLRSIKVDGEPVIGGQSTANGQMVILNYSPVSLEKLAELVNNKLDDKYEINIDEVFASFPTKEEYGYASERSQGTAASERSPLQRDADYLRGEATKLVRDALREAGAKFSTARPDAAGSGRSGAVSDQRIQEVPSYGVSTPGAIQARGYHYSRAVRQVLDGKFYGQGTAGAERRRVMSASDRRIRERIYFYVDAGKGIKPEPGVGANEHVVDLNNLYDAINDKSIQRSVSPDLRGDDWMNAFESSVIDAGYDGYVAPFGNQQAAVLIGNHTVDLAKPQQEAAKLSPPRFYSQLEQTVAQVPARISTQPAPQWKAWLASNASKYGIKKDEIEWSGINDYLDLRGKEKVTAQEIGEYLNLNNVKIDEVIKGDTDTLERNIYSDLKNFGESNGFTLQDGNLIDRWGDIVREDVDESDAAEIIAGRVSDTDTQYEKYQLPGGRSYREMLLTMPSTKTEFQSGHWEESNVLAHIRYNERTDAQGKPVLFIEEIQSDWAQTGRKQGFVSELPEGYSVVDKLNATADAPFVKDTKAWVALAIKRIMLLAAQGGYSKVAFINGKQSADRYDLSKQVDAIAWERDTDGRITFTPEKDNSNFPTQTVTAEELSDQLGKEIADKINSSTENDGYLEGVDLKVGGEGMKSFYDRIVPQVVNDVIKKLGGRMESVPLNILSSEDTGVRGGREHPYAISQDVNEPFDGNVEVIDRNTDQVVWSGPRAGATSFIAEALGNATRTESQPGFTITPEMRQKLQGEGLPLFSPSRQSVAEAISSVDLKSDIANQVKFKLADIIAPGNGFNWFHKTIGTQFHKAKVNPLFKKVFDIGQQFLDDVTLFATRAEDKAMDIFPRFGLTKQLLKMGLSKADNELIGRALADGTLENGADPHTGVVWTDAQLRQKYNMTDKQIDLYRQARAAIDQSLEDLAKSEMGQHMRVALKMSIAPLMRSNMSLKQIRDLLVQTIDQALQANPNADKSLTNARSKINEIYSTTTNLQNHGYAPLMRFGRWTVTATDANGDVQFFQMANTKSEASMMAKNLGGQYAKVEVGEMSQEAFKLFKGISPDTLELFAKSAALPTNDMMQQYLSLAISSRSAMKRLINRKGTSGYSLDATRTLATFITSNARRASTNLNASDMKMAADAIPKEQGDVKDEAVNLVTYLQNPGEEAAKIRGFLFFQYLGGSIASGIVNLTQPILQTYPYLSQFGAVKAGNAMKVGMTAATSFLRGKRVSDPQLQLALERAKAEGLIDPQEIYQLMAASQSGAGSFLSYKFMRLWGLNFAVTELINRALTFSAAYEIGKSMSKQELAKAGASDAYNFAQNAIYETQGIYNKGNRPDWARGAVGGTIFTFKQFSISYVEFLTRLYKNDKKAFGIALAILIMAAGLQGLPGADDLDDVIDTAGNWMGYATNTKRWKRELLESALGKDMAAFALHGVSTIPGMPIDVQARLGLGNMIPGTGLMNPTKKDKAREIAEVFGVAGGMAMSTMDTAEALALGDVRRAGLSILPGAIRNFYQASEMAATGEYRDQRGRKVQDVTTGDVIAKAIGFQPAEIASGNRRMREVQSDIDIVKSKQEEINGKYARAIVDNDQKELTDVRAEIADWNKKNPDLPVKLNMTAIRQRVKQARLTKDARFVKSAPKQIRSQVRESLLAD